MGRFGKSLTEKEKKQQREENIFLLSRCFGSIYDGIHSTVYTITEHYRKGTCIFDKGEFRYYFINITYITHNT